MSKMKYKGSHPTPKFEHGTIIAYNKIGIIQRREYKNNYWEYVILTDVGLLWCHELQLRKL